MIFVLLGWLRLCASIGSQCVLYGIQEMLHSCVATIRRSNFRLAQLNCAGMAAATRLVERVDNIRGAEIETMDFGIIPNVRYLQYARTAVDPCKQYHDDANNMIVT